MSAVPESDVISVEEYLAGELVSPVKHEYLGGVVYPISGARNVHNLIAGNAFASLHTRLRGRRCRPYNSVVVYRRGEQGFAREVYAGLDAVISLPEIETDLPLAEIYDAVEFSPEPADDNMDAGKTKRT